MLWLCSRARRLQLLGLAVFNMPSVQQASCQRLNFAHHVQLVQIALLGPPRGAHAKRTAALGGFRGAITRQALAASICVHAGVMACRLGHSRNLSRASLMDNSVDAARYWVVMRAVDGLRLMHQIGKRNQTKQRSRAPTCVPLDEGEVNPLVDAVGVARSRGSPREMNGIIA